MLEEQVINFRHLLEIYPLKDILKTCLWSCRFDKLVLMLKILIFYCWWLHIWVKSKTTDPLNSYKLSSAIPSHKCSRTKKMPTTSKPKVYDWYQNNSKKSWNNAEYTRWEFAINSKEMMPQMPTKNNWGLSMTSGIKRLSTTTNKVRSWWEICRLNIKLTFRRCEEIWKIICPSRSKKVRSFWT